MAAMKLRHQSSSSSQGCGGYAGEVLREMYGGSLPRAASELLQAHVQARSSSAPPLAGSGRVSPGGSSNGSPNGVWNTGLAARGQRKKVDISIPKVGKNKDLCRSLPPRAPAGRKTQDQILAETENYRRQDYQAELLPAARDRAQETRLLQDRCAYNLGNALPTTAAPLGVSTLAAPAKQIKRRVVTFADGSGRRAESAEPALFRRTGIRGGAGLASEQDLAEDIIRGVQEKQQELESVEGSLATLGTRAEASGEGIERRRLIRKQMVGQSQQQQELKSAIARDMKDLEKLLASET